MKLIKNIIKFIVTFTIFPTQIAWKIRYTAGDERHQIDYLVATSDVNAVAKLQKRVGGKIKIISCEEFKAEN